MYLLITPWVRDTFLSPNGWPTTVTTQQHIQAHHKRREEHREAIKRHCQSVGGDEGLDEGTGKERRVGCVLYIYVPGVLSL
jgi:hypothetical protein